MKSPTHTTLKLCPVTDQERTYNFSNRSTKTLKTWTSITYKNPSAFHCKSIQNAISTTNWWTILLFIQVLNFQKLRHTFNEKKKKNLNSSQYDNHNPPSHINKSKMPANHKRIWKIKTYQPKSPREKESRQLGEVLI